MVELGGVFQLCDSAGGRYLGVSEGGEEGQIVLSLDDGTVSTYNVHDVHCIQSWRLSSSLRLTCPAVVVVTVRRQMCYCAVRNDTELITWNPEVKWATDFTVTTLSRKVQFLLTTPTRTHLLAVFTNGSISLLNALGSVLNTIKTKKNVFYAQSLIVGGQECLVVVGRTRDHTHCSLYAICEEKLSEQGSATMMTPTITSHTLTALTCCGSLLLSLWSNGVVCSADLSFLLQCDHNSRLQSTELIRLKSSITSFTSVGEHHFAVSSMSELRDKKQERLSVYDARYSTLQASTDLNTGSLCQKLYFCSWYLFSSSRDSYLNSCSVSVRKNSLASAMGRKRGTTAEQFYTEKTEHKIKQEKETHVLQWPVQDACQSAIRMLQSFKSSQELVQSCEQLLANDTSSLHYPAVAALFYQALNLILCEEECWPCDLLLSAMKATVLPASLTAFLLKKALARQDWVVISAAMRYLDCVPEGVIVDLLMTAISLPTDFTLKTTDDKTTITRDSLICSIISLPRNDSLIQQPLASLSQDKIISLLTFLNDKVVFEGLIDPSSSSSALTFPYTNVLEWAGLILDTHFTSLSLMPEAKIILVNLHKRVTKQIAFLSHLSLLEGVRNTGKQSLGDDGGWLYKIDRLEIDFSLT